MLAQRPVPVGPGGGVEQIGDSARSAGPTCAFDLHAKVGHGCTLTRPTPDGSLPAMAGPRTPRGRARVVVARLAEEYPGTAAELCALDHSGPFQLLVATILSAQCTDARVNMVTPALFAAYPTPRRWPGPIPRTLEDLIRSTGFFRAKAQNLLGMARALVERFDGEVPTDLEDLVDAARGRAQDGQRGAQRRLRPAGAAGGHPRAAAERAPGSDHRDRPGAGGARAERDRARVRAGRVQPAADPARAQGLRGPPAALCRLLLADVCPSAGCWLPGPTRRVSRDGAPRRRSGKPICPMRVTGESAQWCGEGAKRFVKVLLP